MIRMIHYLRSTSTSGVAAIAIPAAIGAAHDEAATPHCRRDKASRARSSASDIVDTFMLASKWHLHQQRVAHLSIWMQSRALLPAPVANTRQSQCEAGGTRRAQTAWAAGRHGSARLQLRRSAQACRPTSRAARASRGCLPTPLSPPRVPI